MHPFGVIIVLAILLGAMFRFSFPLSREARDVCLRACLVFLFLQWVVRLVV